MSSEEPMVDRRPIASRKRRIWQVTARTLARAGVRPNSISIFGMLAAMLAGAAMVITSFARDDVAQRTLWFAAAALVQIRLLANMLDGMVAVQTGAASPVGELFNEIPDRISDAAVLIGFGLAAGSNPILGCLAACAAVFVAYVRAQGKAAGGPNDFCGPMAKPHRMFIITLAALFLALTPRAWRPELGAAGQWSLIDLTLLAIIAGCFVTAFRRLRHIAAALRGAEAKR